MTHLIILNRPSFPFIRKQRMFKKVNIRLAELHCVVQATPLLPHYPKPK